LQALADNFPRLTNQGIARVGGVAYDRLISGDFGAEVQAQALADQEAVGNQYRDRQSQKLLDVFADAHGRPAETVEELSQWSRRKPAKLRSLTISIRAARSFQPHDPPRN
jgi:hypothetical protein